MTEFHLQNLDLGQNPSEITFEGHVILPVQDYDRRRTELQAGSDVVTALCRSKNKSSALLTRADNSEKEIRDVCYLLTYLTGRTVSLKTDYQKFVTNHKIYPAIDIIQLNDAINAAWESRTNFINDEMKRPFWYFLDVIDIPIIQYISLFTCIALEIVQRIELADIDFKIEKEFAELIDDISITIQESGVDPDTRSRLNGAVQRWRKPSSPVGFKLLLKKYDVYPSSQADINYKKRIKFVNTLRNRIVHGHDLSYPDWVDEEQQFSTTVDIIREFIPNLVREYINRSLNLMDFFQPQMNKKRLRYYLETGGFSDIRATPY